MTKINDLFPNVEFVAYRWVSANKGKKEKVTDNFKDRFETIKYDWKFASNPMEFFENRKASKEIEKPFIAYEEFYEYIELLGLDGTLYYVFSDEKTFDEYIALITGSDFETCSYRLQIRDYYTLKRAKHVRYFKELKKLDFAYLLELNSLDIYIYKEFPVIYFFSQRVCIDDNFDKLYRLFDSDFKISDESQALYYLKNHIKSDKDVYCVKELCGKLDSESKAFSVLGEQLYTLKTYYQKAVEIVQEEFGKEAKQEVQDKIKEAGDIGEQEVKYALRWLDKIYMVLDEGNTIKIRNEKYIDEVQEIDHIVVGPQGVFILETKNYKGKIVIDEQGNWLRDVNGEKRIEKNPIQQIRRHEKLVKSILPESVNVISIICLAHPTSIIENMQMSAVPVVRVDLLSEYIEHFECEKQLSDQEIEQYAQLLMEYKL